MAVGGVGVAEGRTTRGLGTHGRRLGGCRGGGGGLATLRVARRQGRRRSRWPRRRQSPTGGRGGRFGGGRGGRGAAGVGTLEVADGPSADDDDGEFNPAIGPPSIASAVTPLTDAETASAGVSAASLSAKGGHLPRLRADPTTWAPVGLPELLLRARRPRARRRRPGRSVQQRAVPHILRGDDVLIRAETGSGKTLAYMCPLLAAIGAIDPRVSRDEGTRALVMVPTRELAAQVLDTARAVQAVSLRRVRRRDGRRE